MPLHVLHIVAGLPPGGGISESVPALCSHLRDYGIDITLATVKGPTSEAARYAEQRGVHLVQFAPSWPPKLYNSSAMCRNLPELVLAADIVHVHSNWTIPVWLGCSLALKYDKPLVMTPRGCLAPERLKISFVKKCIAGSLFDRRCLKRASIIHATSVAEAYEIKAYLSSAGMRQFSNAQVVNTGADNSGNVDFSDEIMHSRESVFPHVVVIPNGVVLDDFDSVFSDRAFVKTKWVGFENKNIAIFLSRIDPIKGLETLIDAWNELQRDIGINDWLLLVAGNGDAQYVNGLKHQTKKAGLSSCIKFIGPVFGEDKVKLIKAAEFLVLPTRNENFGIVVAESLACGVPVITTKRAPWVELEGQMQPHSSCPEEAKRGVQETGRCGWWIDHGVKPLVAALKEAMALAPEQRKAMGRNGRALVERKYQWGAVTEQMVGVYREIAATDWSR